MAKKLKIKLPKRVAGVKIPKTVRKGPLAGFLNSGAGQLILAQALIAAAGAFTVSRTDPSSRIGELARHPVEGSRRAGHAVAKAGADQAARLSYALKAASHAFRAAMEDGPQAEDAWRNTAVEAEVEPVAKKKQSRSEPATPH